MLRYEKAWEGLYQIGTRQVSQSIGAAKIKSFPFRGPQNAVPVARVESPENKTKIPAAKISKERNIAATDSKTVGRV
jgi:hypothetical protein